MYLKPIIISSLLFLAGCQSTGPKAPKAPLLSGYLDQTPTLIDTINKTQGHHGDNFYFIERINGQKVDKNALTRTVSLSSGRGAAMIYGGNETDLPLGPTKLTISARQAFMAPAMALTHGADNNSVTGVVEINIEPNRHYVLNGHVSESYTAVWIQDESGRIISDMVESFGSDKTKGNEIKQSLIKAHAIENPTPQQIFDNTPVGVSHKYTQKLFGDHEKDITRNRPYIEKKIGYRYFKLLRFKDVGSFEYTCFSHDNCFSKMKAPVISSGKLSTPELIKKRFNDVELPALRFALRDYDKYDFSNQQAVDVFAQKLWEIKDNDRSSTVQAAEQICAIIGESGYYRYDDFLQTLIDADIDSDIVKAAKKAKAQLYRGNRTSFEPQ